MVFIMAKVIMVFIPIHQVCDADLRILSLDATYPGSVHDSKEVTDAIIATLASQWLRFPQTDEEKSEVKRGFCRRGQISGVIGELANIKFLIVTEPGTEGAKQKDRTMQSQCETTGSPYWSSE